MFPLLKLIVLIYCLFSIGIFTPTANSLNCHLPYGCRLESDFAQENYELNEIGDRSNISAIICDINKNDFSFKFKDPPTFVNGSKCLITARNNDNNKIIFRWTSKELTILDKPFDLMYKYIRYFNFSTQVLLWSVKGFDINFLGEKPINYRSNISGIELSKCRLDFYHDKRKINSCDDIRKSNITSIRSIFQEKIKYYGNFAMRSVEYKQSICPLVFNNSFFFSFLLIDLVDTFYKRNVLSFENETMKNLQSVIAILQLNKIRNINLDLKLLHPSVFYELRSIFILSDYLNAIDGAIFRNLNYLEYFNINPIIFRKINHKQGIEWIRQWNLVVNLNLTEMKENKSNRTINAVVKRIVLNSGSRNARKRMSTIFPDKDFCIYIDFPFNQFIILFENIELNYMYSEREFSCTYLWLVQYYEVYYQYWLLKPDFEHIALKDVKRVLASKEFKSISKCKFEKRIDLCNKSNYKIKDIWDESDTLIVSKKMQTAFKIMLYPTALIGLITNIIVVVVIPKKENNDLFKGIKHYSYLYLNSIFCIIIMVIELLSWMTECFYPFEVFCPEIRKLVAIQFFKIIFKECLITLLRFMCSFTYVAFALNRISLIGKDHGKLVTFFSELGIKVFIGVTILISSSLSWIKGFKYQVNFLFPLLNYPMSTEMDISMNASNTFSDVYFIINFICDFLNYVLFVLICVIIDICMVVQLRRVLEEKTKKIESINQKQYDAKKAENENVVNKAIKMVVLNSAIGILFKLPASFIPLLNLVAEFYFKDKMNKYIQPDFGEFYSTLQDTEMYSLIQSISYFLYTLSLSTQIFIYNGFDKKFQTGFERLRENVFFHIKNLFKKSNISNS